ncbi:MAG: hypothetical protein KGL46_11125 [Hyphomicrobiales bacterium]|nr:hypothetical protein [Hyphomicrobiales bacterium]
MDNLPIIALVLALAFALYWIAFRLPARGAAQPIEVFIAASPAAIWPRLQPSGWNGLFYDRRFNDVTLADADERVWTYEEVSAGGRAAYRLTQPVYERDRRLINVVTGVNGVDIAPDRQFGIVYDLHPADGGTRLRITLETREISAGARYSAFRTQESFARALQGEFQSRS